jgi:hypothetical protein
MTLHLHKVDDHTIIQDGDQLTNIPLEWKMATGTADDIRVCGAHPWQSRWLIFDNGDVYGTAACGHPDAIGECACRCRVYVSRKQQQKLVFLLLMPENRAKNVHWPS